MGKSFLIDPAMPGAAPVPVLESDLEQLQLDEVGFAKWIALSNGLNGKQQFDGPLWSLGSATINGTHVQFQYLAAASGDAALGAALSVGDSVPLGRVVVILCADFDWADALTLRSLEARRVVATELEGLINTSILDLRRVTLPPLDSSNIGALQVIQHIDRRFDTLGREYSALQQENELLMQKLADQLVAIGKKVDPKFFHWVVTLLGAGSNLAASKLLGVPNSTLADGLKKFAARGGLYRTLMALVEARQASIGKKSTERFNEAFLSHQGSGPEFQSDAELLRTVVEGLAAMDADNWESVQSELMKMLEESIPER